MRRSLFFTVFVALCGLLTALVPTTAVAADGACEGEFAARLSCWVQRAGSGTVLVTLDDELPLKGGQQDLEGLNKENARALRDKLVVEVPADGRTGKGGTVLLLLAGGRLVDRTARIDRLPTDVVNKLRDAGVCEPRNLHDPCGVVETADPKQAPLSGRELIDPDVAVAADRATHRDSIAERHDNSLFDSPTFWIVLSMSILLAVLLVTLLAMIRRSRAPAAPRRTLALAGAGPLPSGPRPTARTPDEPATRRRPDPATTRLRTTTPRHGRDVGGRSGPARAAVVRTDLHPQGYVELDRVLYRAVWADPGRPPPGPGSSVDVTDARERDSDVLYAFPSTAGRHAKGSR